MQRDGGGVTVTAGEGDHAPRSDGLQRGMHLQKRHRRPVQKPRQLCAYRVMQPPWQLITWQDEEQRGVLHGTALAHRNHCFQLPLCDGFAFLLLFLLVGRNF